MAGVRRGSGKEAELEGMADGSREKTEGEENGSRCAMEARRSESVNVGWPRYKEEPKRLTGSACSAALGCANDDVE
jgi:hypothetical protein